MANRRRSPRQHTVLSYKKTDGTEVKSYRRGSGSTKTQKPKIIMNALGDKLSLFASDPYAPAKFFGTTKDPNQSLWIMPNGSMISGSIGNKNLWSDYAHKDAVKAYGLNSSDDDARKWMKLSKAIRMRRSSIAPDATLNLEMYSVPSDAQMSTISRAVDREGSIYIDFWSSDGQPILSQRCRHAGELKATLDRIN